MSWFKRFKADQRGSVATMFALSALPMIGLVGAAVDYGRAAMAQSKMQTAIDQIALQIVKQPITITQSQMDKIGTEVLQATFGAKVGAPSDQGFTIAAPVIVRQGKDLTVEARGSAANTLFQVIGAPSIGFGAKAGAAWSKKKIELALVLDNTGSMGDFVGGRQKLTELIAATKKLLSDAKAKATDADSIRISIVPFDTEVRVDASAHRNASWFRFIDPTTTRSQWTGYVVDRFGTLAGSDTGIGNEASKHSALKASEHKTDARLMAMSTADLQPILPLTSVKDGYNTMVDVADRMKARGFTNIGLGISWGLATLSSGEPFTETRSGSDQVERFMIVLTDGNNTAYHRDGVMRNAQWEREPVRSAIVGEIDAITKSACGEARKVATVHTIRLLEGNVALLRNCASGPNTYHEVSSPAALSQTFEDILKTILATRITS